MAVDELLILFNYLNCKTMIPNKFDYHRASSVDEAISLMAQHGMDAKLLAGGHSLLPAMKLRLNQPGVLIDIGRLDELRYIKKEGNELVIGAGATHDDIAHSAAARSTFSMLSEAADLIGDVQVRNKGTIGGSLAHADPAADWPAVMIAANAQIELQGPNGSRSVAADDFFRGVAGHGAEGRIAPFHTPAAIRDDDAVGGCHESGRLQPNFLFGLSLLADVADEQHAVGRFTIVARDV